MPKSVSDEPVPTQSVHIWVDADACPKEIREILFRAAERRRIPLTLVANRPLRLRKSLYVQALLVPGGLDEADRAIAREVRAGDLVVTADIPLAAAVVGKGAFALDPRGTLHTLETVGERLSVRDWLDALRGAGVPTAGPPALKAADRKAFADALDRFLARRMDLSPFPSR